MPAGTGRVSRRAAFTALITDDFVWDTADRLDAAMPRDPTIGGRPRAYPMVIALIRAAAVQMFESSRQVEVEFADLDAGWWPLVRATAASKRPGLQLPARPPNRANYAWLRNHYLQTDEGLAVLGDLHRRHAAQQAVTIGLCDPNGEGSYTHPSLDRVVAGDGKVLTPRFKATRKNRRRLNRRTGELRILQIDPDAETHITGGGDQVWGNKFVITSTRGDARNQRIILDINRSPKKDGEAKWAVQALDQVLPHLPGTQAVVYDGAFRGVHLNHLMTRHGIPVIANMHSGQHGTVTNRHYGPATLTRPDGTTDTIDIHLVNGTPNLRQINVNGDIILHPATRTRTVRRLNRDGHTWRLYNHYTLPAEIGAGTFRLRLDRTADDLATGLNRAEHLRAIAPDDPDHPAIYGRRNDTESGNRLLDDSMLRERAHTIGWRRQQVDVTMWAILRNAIAVTQHRRRTAPLQLAA